MTVVAVAFTGPRTIGFVREVRRELAPHEVRVRTLYSGVSAGTEMTAYRGTNPYLHKRWDASSRLFVLDPEREGASYPVVGWGYEEVGEVVEVGGDSADVALGSIVYGTWGHRTETVMEATRARRRLLAPGVDHLYGVFSQLGAIALNGVLDGALRLGETTAVFGLGVVGQLVSQLARLSGARVIGVDLLPNRLECARNIGLDAVLDGSEGGVAERIRELTEGRGADVCIEASGSAQALHEAVRSVAYSSRVVAMGFFQGQANALYLGEEFHHNRINIVCSQISGVAPDLAHRWNQDRLVTTFMSLVESDRLNLRPLVTHILPAAEAPELFRLLEEEQTTVMQTVLDFREGIPDSLLEG